MVDIANEHESSLPVATTEQLERSSGNHSGTTTATATRYLLAGIRLALGWVFL